MPRFSPPPRRDGDGLEPGLGQGQNPAYRPCPRGIAIGGPLFSRCVPRRPLGPRLDRRQQRSALDRRAEERIEALPTMVKELTASDATILVAAGTPATLTANRVNQIPLVLVGVDGPVSLDLVDTLMQLGGNAVQARDKLPQQLQPFGNNFGCAQR